MIEIRREQPDDALAIHELTRIAFHDMPFSDGDEHHLIDRLRGQGVLTLSLVAVTGASSLLTTEREKKWLKINH